jgi:riboflavin synthase
MFTGIIEATGVIVSIDGAESGRSIWVNSPALSDVEIGGSVAIDGVCLTATERDGDATGFDVAMETLARSALGGKTPGDAVNLERPLRAGDELGGHMVQGHVDGVGRIERIIDEGQSKRIHVSATPSVLRYLVEKGSVTIDGISLTVTAVDETRFEVAVIPHTMAVTTLGGAEVGRIVNLEVDVLAKYVERLVSPFQGVRGRSSADALRSLGVKGAHAEQEYL